MVKDLATSVDLIFKALEIIAIVGGGFLFMFKVGRMTSRFEMTIKEQNRILAGQSQEITELKNETKKLGDVLTQIAVQDQRLVMVEQNMAEIRRKCFKLDYVPADSRG